MFDVVDENGRSIVTTNNRNAAKARAELTDGYSMQFNPSTAELVRAAADADASPEFLAALAAENDGLPRRRVMYALENVRDIKRHCIAAGGFMAALWDGNQEKAAAKADAENTAVLESAGLIR